MPPRVIEAKPLEAAVPQPVGELPPVAQLPPRPRPAAARETAKVEPKPAEPPPADQPPPAATPPAPAVPQLRTPGTVDGAEATRQVGEVIERARRALNAIDYRRLTSERKNQYNSAKLMVTESENALKKSDFEFARNLAEKAERLARELTGR